MAHRIAVFTAALSHHVVGTIAAILRDAPETEFLVLHHVPQRSRARLVRNQWRNLGRHGWRWIPYQAGEIGARLAPRPRATPRQTGHDRTPEWLAAHRQVTIRRFASINRAPAVEALREWAPDLGLSLAAPILKPALFTVPRLGTLNIHKGELPRYRGMPPAFWEIWNGESHVGVSVHKVEAGLDTGALLLTDRVPLEPFATPAGVRVQLDELGVKLMAQAVRLMLAGAPAFRPQEGEGRTYTRPTLAQERALARRIEGGLNPRRVAKSLALSAYGAASAVVPAADRVVILLYHRVNDEQRDAVTIGVERFEQHMRLLADHYQLVRLEDLLGAAPLPRGGPLVAVTFDDGYRDNYTRAAPILLKHGVHATFFVSTDKVTHNAPFEHDLEKLGRGLPNMSWDEAREMHAEGLGFGSHTANHVNMAGVPAEVAAEELARSRDTLARELGIAQPMFAYPFGKRRDFTPERLAQVQAAGYRCNCSAYGGINARDLDRWDIRRQGVDHNFDVAALRALIAGWNRNRHV